MTRRETILDAIATKLATITTGNGYNTTVTTVEQVLKSWATVKTAEMPWLGISSDPRAESDVDETPFGTFDVTMPVVIVGHVSALPGAAKTAALANLEDDLIVAMYDDHTFSDNATDVAWQGTATDEGDDYTKPFKPSGTIIMRFDVRYERLKTTT